MKKNIIYEKSGGRRFPIYAEIGTYFSADGTLDEKLFRQHITSEIQKIKNKCTKSTFPQKAAEWLSEYVNRLLGYLSEKGVINASIKLFKIVLEESKIHGLENLTIATEQLGYIMHAMSSGAEGETEKKSKSDDKRKKILNASIAIFAREGFHSTTIDQIAEEADIGKGSVYRYFKSKDLILEELLETTFADIAARISSIYSKEMDILQLVEEMIKSWITFISENPDLYQIIQNEAMNYHSGNRVMFYDYMVTHLPLFKERVVSLNNDKQLKTTSFYTVFYGIMGFIDGVVQKWQRCGMDYPLNDDVPIILEVLFNGFVGEKTTRKKYFIPPEDDA